MKNKPGYVIIHHTGGFGANAIKINDDHQNRKPISFYKIGYHYLILNGCIDWTGKDYIDFLDGSIETGREEHEEGAHCPGFNCESVSICLVGLKDFTAKQMLSLLTLTRYLMKKYDIPTHRVLGHKETPHGMAAKPFCPNIDMAAFRDLLNQA